MRRVDSGVKMKLIIPYIAIILTAQIAIAHVDAAEWMTSYYKSPSPSRFIPEVRSLVKEGALKRENSKLPIIAFLSQVMRANPDKIESWLEEFENIDDDQKAVLYASAWYSHTEQALSYFKQRKLHKYLEEPAPDILALKVNNPSVLDMLWGYYFATGEEEPIRRIITAFDYSKFAGALEKHKDSEKTKQQMDEIYWDVFFGAAMWSLDSNCRQHQAVQNICETILDSKDLSDIQKCWLQTVMHNVKYETKALKVDNNKTAQLIPYSTPDPDFDFSCIDNRTARIGIHACEYPPTFQDAKQREKIESELKDVITLIDKLLAENPNSPSILIRSGYLHSMGHNLDFHHSAEEAIKSFETLLCLEPENPEGNYLFGMFLVGTASYQQESTAFLEKALILGVEEAKYTLGLNYLREGDEQKGIQYLEQYKSEHPNSRASSILKAYKDGTLEFKTSD